MLVIIFSIVCIIYMTKIEKDYIKVKRKIQNIICTGIVINIELQLYSRGIYIITVQSSNDELKIAEYKNNIYYKPIYGPRKQLINVRRYG